MNERIHDGSPVSSLHQQKQDQPQRKYDSTIVRVAGNIASGLVTKPDIRCSPNADSRELTEWVQSIAMLSVAVARAIVLETERSEAHALGANEHRR